jgi:hypothetical protein
MLPLVRQDGKKLSAVTGDLPDRIFITYSTFNIRKALLLTYKN